MWLIIIVHLEQRLAMLNGELGNGGDGRENSAMHAKVMAEDIAQNRPLLQPPIDCLLLLLTIPIILCLSSGAAIDEGHFTFNGASPSYPSSASTRSNTSSQVVKPEWKISRSFHSPGKKGPWIQHMSPVLMFNATSYRNPDEFALQWRNCAHENKPQNSSHQRSACNHCMHRH